MSKIERIWHPWNNWECYRSNFFGSLPKSLKKAEALKLCQDLYKNVDEFERVLLRILKEWPNSCEHNLSNLGMNRIAWLGQAACAYKYRIPNMVGMQAFSEMEELYKAPADAVAQKIIDLWEGEYGSKNL